MFILKLSPRWELEHDGVTIEVPSPKLRVLLTYLILEKSSIHRREQLSELFWEGDDRRKSLGSLRQALHGLKQYIDPVDSNLLVLTKSEISLDQELVRTELDDVANALGSGQIDAGLTRRIEDCLRVVDEMGASGRGLEKWAYQARSQIFEHFVEQLKLVFLSDLYPLEVRKRAAQTVHQLDEFDEDAVRTIMRCSANLGNSAAALILYDAFYKRLEDELDTTPSTATQDLAVDIKLSQDDGTSVPALASVVRTRAPTRSMATVAVLPFESLGADLIPDYLIIGLLDQVTCHLSSFRAPAVISSNTTRKYLGVPPDPQIVGRELGVDYVVAGSIRTDARDALLSLQVVKADDGHIVWAKSHQADPNNLFSIQSTIIENIASAIVPTINVSELERTADLDLADLDPYHLVLRAKEKIFGLDLPEFSTAGELLRQAIEIGPQFAPAHALLAEWYAINVWQGWSSSPRTDRTALDTHARRAVSLSPGDGRVMALWGHSRFMFDREYDQALSMLHEAIEHCPNDAETLIWSVPTLALASDPKMGIENGEIALELSPLDPFMFRNEHFLGLAYYANGDFDRSAELGLSCFRRAPSYGSNLRATIAALSAAGRKEETVELVAKHDEVSPGFSVEKFIPNHGFRDRQNRETFGRHLVAAGMPP